MLTGKSVAIQVEPVELPATVPAPDAAPAEATPLPAPALAPEPVA